MPRQLTLGNLSPDVRAAEELELPFLDGPDAVSVLTDALDLCAVHRRGMGVDGPKGSGKSEGRADAVRAFEEAEAEKLAADASYEPRRILCMTAPRATVAGSAAGGDGGLTAAGRVRSATAGRLPSYRGVLLALLAALYGAPPNDRVRGRRKTDHELIADAVETAAALNVAVVVVDDAERLGPDGFTAFRDFMADAAEADGRRQALGRVGGLGDSVRGLRAAGVGVLLIGTPEIKSRLERTDEAGQRWAGCVSVSALAPGDLPAVYRAAFPAFAAGERAYDAARGPGAWRRYVVETVAAGRTVVSLRLAAFHAREYYRLLVRNLPPETAAPAREAVPFDADLFTLTARRANWHVPASAGAAANGTVAGLPPAEVGAALRAAAARGHAA